MQYRLLGNTGVVTSRLALGTWTFARDEVAAGKGRIDAALADRMVGVAIDGGINLFDTADRYMGGESESVLGECLRGKRDSVLLTTKAGLRNGPALTDVGLSRRHIMRSVEASLKRLGTDWIDFYIAHRDDPLTPLEETLHALDDLVRQGKVRYLGFSNWPTWRASAAMEIQRARNLAPFTHGQIYYSLIGRDAESEIFPMARHYGCGITVWSPLVMGVLSGKYDEESLKTDSRISDLDLIPFDRDTAFRAIALLREIARIHDATPSRIALAWLLSKPDVTSIIVGATRLGHLEDNLQAATLALSGDEIGLLDAVCQPAQPYPVWYRGLVTDEAVTSALADSPDRVAQT